MRKILIYILLCAILLSSIAVLAGCNETENPGVEEETTEAVTVEDYDFPDVEKKDYGDSFHFYVGPNNGGERLWYMDADMNTGSTMDEAVFQRQERVRKYLGVEFVNVTYPDVQYNTYHTYIQTAIQNMDGTVDALVTHVHGGVSNLISENLLKDFSDLPAINLDAEYWQKDFMDTLELSGRYFLGHSDYNIMMTYIIGFNKELYESYCGDFEMSVYDMVREGEWTLDMMIKIAKRLSIDVTGNGKSSDDYFGLTAVPWGTFNGFLTSFNIPMVSQTQSGAYEVAITKKEYIAKADEIVEIFRELDEARYTYFTYSNKNTTKIFLSSGRALMNVLSTTDLEGLLNYDIEFGVLPYPLYDKAQYDKHDESLGYKMLQWGGYLAVPSYTKNQMLVCETLEMLSYYSENVQVAYYEKVLGKRVADMPDDAAMLDIIWNSLATDVGQTFYNLGGDEKGVCYTLPDMMLPGTTDSLTTYLNKREDLINSGFRRFLAGIK